MKVYIKPLMKIKDCQYKYYLCDFSGGRGASHGNDGSDPNGNGSWYNEGYEGDPIGTPNDGDGLGSMGKRGFWDY